MPIKFNAVIFVLLALWDSCWQVANAAIIHDLYSAKIAVSDQSDRNQKKAFSLALKQVLVKVRGNDDLLSNAQIKKAASKATSLVRSYRYDNEQSQLYLFVNFDAERIEGVIRSAGFPVWDKRRPESIIWLAIEPSNDAIKQIATVAQYNELYQRLSETAKQRGIVLMFPIWDLDDIQALSVYDIWGGFSKQINEASERYAVQSVLSARIYLANNEPLEADQSAEIDRSTSNGKWLAEWTMIENGSYVSGHVQSDDLLLVGQNLVDSIADQLSLKYAIDLADVDKTAAKTHITVNNIDSMIYYTRALKFLETLSVVNSVTLISQKGQQATFELDLLGDVRNLKNVLNLAGNIKPVLDDFGQPINDLEFFWVK